VIFSDRGGFDGIFRWNHTPRIHPVHTAAAYALHKYSIQKERNRVRSRHTFSLRTIYLLHHAPGRRFTAMTIKTLMPILDFDISPVSRVIQTIFYVRAITRADSI